MILNFRLFKLLSIYFYNMIPSHYLYSNPLFNFYNTLWLFSNKLSRKNPFGFLSSESWTRNLTLLPNFYPQLIKQFKPPETMKISVSKSNYRTQWEQITPPAKTIGDETRSQPPYIRCPRSQGTNTIQLTSLPCPAMKENPKITARSWDLFIFQAIVQPQGMGQSKNTPRMMLMAI